MKELIPKDTRYMPLVQQKYCCTPTSILIVMQRHGLPLIEQEVLGYHLGLVVPPDVKDLFWNVRVSKEVPRAGYGTRIFLPEYNPNKAFQKLKIPLKFNLRHVSEFTAESFKEYLAVIDRDDKDVLVCFDHGHLRGDNIPGGHVCVIDRVNIKKNQVRLIDPQQNQPKWRVVNIDKLKAAMDFHGDSRSAGFWELSPIRKKRK